jgi:hypothetical protein
MDLVQVLGLQAETRETQRLEALLQDEAKEVSLSLYPPDPRLLPLSLLCYLIESKLRLTS